MAVSPACRTAVRTAPLPAASDGRLAVARHAASGGLVLTLSGELDVADTGTLNTHIDAAVAQSQCRLVLDLHGLEFCDCAGLGALLRARRLTAAHQGWTRLARVQPRISRTIRTLGLHGALACYPSVRRAFDDAAEPAPSPVPRKQQDHRSVPCRSRDARPPRGRPEPLSRRPPCRCTSAAAATAGHRNINALAGTSAQSPATGP